MLRRAFKSASSLHFARPQTSTSRTPSSQSAGCAALRPTIPSRQIGDRHADHSQWDLELVWVKGMSEHGSRTSTNLSRAIKHRLTNDLRYSLAMSEMCVVIAKLFWHFDVGCLADEDWLDQSCYLLWRQKPLPLSVSVARASKDRHGPAEIMSSA